MNGTKRSTRMIRGLWQDETGGTLTTEVMLLVTVLVIGLIVGAKSFRDAAATEWADYAQAIANWDQSYNIPDTDPSAVDNGSGFVDARDFCDDGVNATPFLSTNDAFNDVPTSFIRYGVNPTGE